MSSLLNEHAHPVVDEHSDGIFVIDPVDRTITLEVDGTPVYFGGPVIVKGDINSERLTFKIPKVIEGHDMSSCDTVRIHYITINPETSAQYPDVYDVLKKDIAPDGDDYLKFSWLIDHHVTRYASPVSFVVQFACTRMVPVDDEQKLVYDYSWSTVPYTELRVSDGFVNNKQEDADAFVDQYNSIVTQWHNEIEEAIARSDARTITKLEQTEFGEDDGDDNVWTATFGSGETSTLTVKNGSKGSDGKSAYEVARDNGFDGSEQEWVETLATSYVECLKGRTITQAEFDALSEEEQNREGYVYVIKDAEIHAHTADTATVANHATTADTADTATHADTADSATNANHATTADTADSATNANHATTADSAIVSAGYTTDGPIATAISEINKALDGKSKSDHTHDDYALTDHTHDEFDEIRLALEENNISDLEETVSGAVPVSYTTGSYIGGRGYAVTSEPQTITAPSGCTFTKVEILSCALSSSMEITYETPTAVISEDGKTITFSISGYSYAQQSGNNTATISYECTYKGKITQCSLYAYHLTLSNIISCTLNTTDAVAINGVSPGRTYILSLNVKSAFGTYTGVIHIPSTFDQYSTSCNSTCMGGAGNSYYCRIYLNSDNVWKIYVYDAEAGSDNYVAGTITLIEL